MAKDASFDIVSEFDRQELVNAVDQVKRDITSRFDLKDSGTEIELDADKMITITAKDDMKLRNVIDILQSKMVKRNLSIKILDAQPKENALGGNIRQVFNLKKGLSMEIAKKIVADIKNTKLKVQASIQGEQVRVSGKSKDDLQAIIKLMRENEEKYDIALQFTNYR
ncbi:YajQ family cyclic di-GMP-binding protein [bacterium]|nr:YajQ family cyclic di-GMP-binding protein [bacterium]